MHITKQRQTCCYCYRRRLLKTSAQQPQLPLPFSQSSPSSFPALSLFPPLLRATVKGCEGALKWPHRPQNKNCKTEADFYWCYTCRSSETRMWLTPMAAIYGRLQQRYMKSAAIENWSGCSNVNTIWKSCYSTVRLDVCT